MKLATACIRFRSRALGKHAQLSSTAHIPGLYHHGRCLIKELGLVVCVEPSSICYIIQDITAREAISRRESILRLHTKLRQ